MMTIKLGTVQVNDEFIRIMKIKTEEKGFKYDFDIKDVPDYVPKLGSGFEKYESNKNLSMSFQIEDNQIDSFKEFCIKHLGYDFSINKDKK